MITFVESVLLFLPVFLVVNLVASVPGRPSLREACRVGVRHFLIGTGVIFGASVVLYFLMNWLISRPPLW